jgi:hypothetical protein
MEWSHAVTKQVVSNMSPVRLQADIPILEDKISVRAVRGEELQRGATDFVFFSKARDKGWRQDESGKTSQSEGCVGV